MSNKENKVLSGTSLAGMSTTRERIKDDFYATPENAIRAILDVVELKGSILEPACGDGAISKILKEYYPNSEIISQDLVDRGYGIGGVDYLTFNPNRKFDNIITNPPFNLAKEFIEKSLELANDKVIIFAKIQLLESESRKDLFLNSPLKYIYVFSKRVSPLRNGKPLNEKGKPWASTMCFAWFVWEIGYTGEPIVRWL